MKLPLDCIPCFVRSALNSARFATSDAAVHEILVQEALQLAQQSDGHSAPWLSQRLQRRLRELTGNSDPYRDAKHGFNELALALLPEFRAQLSNASDPLEFAVRLATAANIIDLGVYHDLTEDRILMALQNALSEDFSGDIDIFRNALKTSRRILFLADNAGEIVFDRLLLEQLPPGTVTVAVRGHAVLNDATRQDAGRAGLESVAALIDNGSDAPGTILEDCNTAFREIFSRADLIIAKGQGNYETLRNLTANIFFLLKVKCPVVSSETGLPIGTQALLAPQFSRDTTTCSDATFI